MLELYFSAIFSGVFSQGTLRVILLLSVLYLVFLVLNSNVLGTIISVIASSEGLKDANEVLSEGLVKGEDCMESRWDTQTTLFLLLKEQRLELLLHQMLEQWLEQYQLSERPVNTDAGTVLLCHFFWSFFTRHTQSNTVVVSIVLGIFGAEQ
jgi:hypothetical protein